jgi:hypothetical protein
MKAKILLPLTFIFALQLHAQIVLDANDLPKSGDVNVFVKVDSIQAGNILPGNSGSSVVWDFSNLEPCCEGLQNSYDTLSWIQPVTTPYYSSFPFSDLAHITDCRWEHSHVTHQDELICNYVYYIKIYDGVLLYGYYDSDAKIYDRMRYFFPLMLYGDTLKEEARLIYYTAVDTVRVLSIQSISVADGWGTVITPTDSSEALRVHTAELIYDSIYINGIGNLNKITDSSYYYHWFTKNLGFPILQIYRSVLHQDGVYYQDASYSAIKPIVLGTPDLFQKEPIKVINEWGSRTVTFLIPEDLSNRNYFIEFFDLTGRRISPQLTIRSDQILASFVSIPGGIYLYRISKGSETLKTGKISVH